MAGRRRSEHPQLLALIHVSAIMPHQLPTSNSTVKPKKRNHTSITGKTLFGTDAEFYLAFALPYARWICADGRELLVNGFGEPIWQRQPKSLAESADPYEKVRNVVWIERIYSDADRHHEKRQAAKKWLETFRDGFPITIMPESRERIDSAGEHSGPGAVRQDRRRSA
jgi:hypothetical protein